MIFGKVVGTVVATQRSDRIKGAKYLLVERCSARCEPKGDYHVALDALDAGVGEMVLIAQGSSARQTEISYQKPIDAIVTGIVDLVDERGEVVFRK